MTNPMVPNQYTNVERGEVVLKRHVIIGSSSVILPGVTIGEGSAVGALSLVNKSLPDWGIFSGIPARRLRDRSQNLLKHESEFLKSIGAQ
jgi:galactoside O-acetyltransferase